MKSNRLLLWRRNWRTTTGPSSGLLQETVTALLFSFPLASSRSGLETESCLISFPRYTYPIKPSLPDVQLLIATGFGNDRNHKQQHTTHHQPHPQRRQRRIRHGYLLFRGLLRSSQALPLFELQHAFMLHCYHNCSGPLPVGYIGYQQQRRPHGHCFHLPLLHLLQHRLQRNAGLLLLRDSPLPPSC